MILALLLIPTRHPTGFRKNPSLVSNAPRSLNSNSNPLATVPTIMANSISATFRPTQALGPTLKGTKAAFCASVMVPGAQREGLNSYASGPQMEGEWCIV